MTFTRALLHHRLELDLGRLRQAFDERAEARAQEQAIFHVILGLVHHGHLRPTTSSAAPALGPKGSSWTIAHFLRHRRSMPSRRPSSPQAPNTPKRLARAL